MSVSAEASGAELPLPGGVEGATVRLHPLLTGEMLAPPGFLEKPKGRFATPRAVNFGRRGDDWVWLPIPAFLIEHPGVGPVLVDTGLHPSVAIDPTQNWGRIAGRINTFRMTPEQGLHAQLRARGVEPGDVKVIVMTHMHWDHASGVSEFPGATYVLDRREWDVAIRRGGLLRGYIPSQFDYGFDWRAVDYDRREIDSFATFGQAVDVFGDGSVRLLSTPGHSLGHQSVLVRLREREALLTGDAIYERRALDRDIEPLIVADAHRYWRSIKEIRRFLEQTPGTLVIPGHDHVVWPELDAVYE